jgi:segregation and condensation protein B
MVIQPHSHPESEPPQGISLEELADAFAQVMGQAPRSRRENEGQPEAEEIHSAEADEEGEGETASIAGILPGVESLEGLVSTKTTSANHLAEDHCPIGPQSIFEAMLFVGNRENRPLSAARAAELMRDVAAEEIPALVEELNAGYARANRPYRILGEGDGYRLTLRKDLYPLRDKFYGRIREARLSQAAIDVLALVAYNQPLTGEQVGKLRGKPSGHILAQLVRRGLLRLERPADKPRSPHYTTTDRFMRLFNLESLDDLPRSEEPG